MVKGKLWIVLNPIAGKGNAAKQYPKIERFLLESGRDFEILLTKGSGDAPQPAGALELVRNLPLTEGDAVVAAGGDGTCNEVVNGLFARSPPPPPPLIGVLPVGRGNDFSSALGIPGDVEKALEILVAGKIRPLDAGFVKGGRFPDGRYFVNVVGIGFDTKVVFEAAKLKIKSDISYALGALINVIRYDPSPVLRIRYNDNEMTLPTLIVSFANGRRMGGIFHMSPDALLDDGLLDFCAAEHRSSRFKLLNIVYRYTRATHTSLEGMHTGRASHFHLEALEGGMAAHCDGETVCENGKELEITCIPGALRVIGT